MSLVFEGVGSRPGEAAADELLQRTETRRDLRRMWHGTFGRLPAASPLALKHRTGSGAVSAMRPDARPGPPRMKVPPPVLLGGQRAPAAARRAAPRRAAPSSDGGGGDGGGGDGDGDGGAPSAPRDDADAWDADQLSGFRGLAM